MVFKTVDSEFTKSGKSLALFKKEWHDLKNDFVNAKGLINKVSALFSTGLTNDDIRRLKEYNNLINKGQNSQSAYYRTLKNASSAAQNLAAQANGAAVSEEALAGATNKVTIATKLAHGAMRLLANVGLALAINLIITGISKAVNRFKEIKESTDNLISSFKFLNSKTDSLTENSNTLIKSLNLKTPLHMKKHL